MNFGLLIALGGWILAVLQFVYSFYKDKKEKEKIRQLEIEAKNAGEQLALIRSRAKGPYWMPLEASYGTIYVTNNGRPGMCSAREGSCVLSARNPDVAHLEAGSAVLFLIDNNKGADVREVAFKSDIKELHLETEPQINGAHGCEFLVFEYEPEKYGKRVEFDVSFESSDGHQDTHTYEMIYGQHKLRRLRPASVSAG